MEKRSFAGIEYKRFGTREQFDQWVVANGWPDVKAFERDTLLTFQQLKGVWFYVIKHSDRHFAYARGVSGVRVLR